MLYIIIGKLLTDQACRTKCNCELPHEVPGVFISFYISIELCAKCRVYPVELEVYSVQNTVYTVQCTVYSVQCIANLF